MSTTRHLTELFLTEDFSEERNLHTTHLSKRFYGIDVLRAELARTNIPVKLIGCYELLLGAH